MQRDLVTVVIPAYNAERYLADAVRSVFSQDYRPLEVVIVDDGSMDSTVKIANLLLSEAPQQVTLVSVQLAKNQGAANALNVGFAKAHGRYICWLSADDMFTDSDKTARQVSAINRSGGDWSYFRDYYSGTTTHCRYVRTSYLPPIHHSTATREFIRLFDLAFVRNSELRLMALLFRNPINGSSIMIAEHCIRELGQFDPVLGNVDADADLWMRYSALGARATPLDGGPVFMREHAAQTSMNRPIMRRGSAVTRLRILSVLEETDRLFGILRRNTPFTEWFLSRRIFDMPATAKHVSNFVLANRHRFNSMTCRLAKLCYRNTTRQILREGIDEEEIRSETARIQQSREMEGFERLLRSRCP